MVRASRTDDLWSREISFGTSRTSARNRASWATSSADGKCQASKLYRLGWLPGWPPTSRSIPRERIAWGPGRVHFAPTRWEIRTQTSRAALKTGSMRQLLRTQWPVRRLRLRKDRAQYVYQVSGGRTWGGSRT